MAQTHGSTGVKSRKAPPFRAEHVGSLKRPDSLQEARVRILGPHAPDRNLGYHQNQELRAIEDAAIREVIRLQEDVGLKDITDGEFRRHTWWTDFFLGLDGVKENTGKESPIEMVDKSGHRLLLPSIAIEGRIKWRGSILRRDFEFTKSTTGQTAKAVIPAPMELHYLIGGPRNVNSKVYPELDALLEDLAAAYQQEIADLADAGCTYLQLDDVTFGFLSDPARREEVKSWGVDADGLLEKYTSSFNRAVSKRPAGMTIAIHVCRGNRSGHWGAQGGYDPVADMLFNRLDADAYFLEYDSARAGSFDPLRLVPQNKTVVLGLVTTKDAALESADGLKRRIEEASRFIPLEQLAVSPQCGFSANFRGNPVTIDDQMKKLSLIVGVARDVWGTA